MLRLAYRNLLRNARRSLITLSAITFGLASLIFVWGFIDGINEQIVENTTSYLTGHMKIHKRGFHDTQALHLATGHDPETEARVREMNSVTAIAPRVEDKAMISGDKESRGVRVIGIDPLLERDVTTLNKAIIKGRYLEPGDSNSIVLGDKLASITGLNIGDDAILISQARDGSLAAERYRLVGVFDSGIDMIDGAFVYISLASAQELYSLWGQITSWAIRLEQRRSSEEISLQINTALGSEYEVLDWKKLFPGMVQMVRMHDVMGYIVLFIVIVVVTVGVANTILMAVMDRTREFGVMLALGTKQNQIIQLVILESSLLGVTGLVLGNILGLSISYYFSNAGLDLSDYTLAMETMPGLSGMVYPLLRLDHVIIVSIVTFAVSILPALFPAWRASRLQPVEAIHDMVKPHRLLQWPSAIKTSLIPSQAMFLKIAFRGILRNPRRSLLTSAATAFGLGSFLFLYAIADGFFEQMIDNSTDYLTAHLQIEQTGFRQEFSPSLTIEQPTGILENISAHPAVAAATPRIKVSAIASSPTQTEPLILHGVKPESETLVTSLQRTMVAGEYLPNAPGNTIILGRKLSEELDIQVGEKLVITVQLADGSLGSAAYRLVGIFDTGNEFFNRTVGFIGLTQAQKLMNMEDAISTIAIRLKDRAQADNIAMELNQTLSGTPYQAKTWEQIMPVLVQMVGVTRLNFYVVLIVVFAVVAIGVTNTLLMAVLERTREFGVMMAIGTQPGYIVRIVLYESVLLGALGILAGIVLGSGLVAYYHDVGIDLSGFAGISSTIPGLTDVIYPLLLVESVWLPTLVLFITGIIAAFYPANRAARLEPIVAIRHL